MISLNTQNKLPGNALVYLIVGRAIIGIILIVVGFFLMSLGSIHGTTTVNGVTSPTSFSATIPALVLMLLGVLLPLWTIFWYLTFSYTVGDQSITINSGVLFRQSKTIDFIRIQNVDNTRGPLEMIFGLASVNIWTAAQDQFRVSTVNIGGIPRTQTSARPDGKLYLARQDAEDLKNHMANKGSVQNVQMVSGGAQ